MESNGETIEITGLTQDECREAAESFGDVLTVTIEPSNAAHEPTATKEQGD
jgi:hypothetical protein